MSERYVSKHVYEDLNQPYKAREQPWTNQHRMPVDDWKRRARRDECVEKGLPVPLYSLDFDGPEASTGGNTSYTRPVFLPPVLAESIEHILSDQVVWEILERLIQGLQEEIQPRHRFPWYADDWECDLAERISFLLEQQAAEWVNLKDKSAQGWRNYTARVDTEGLGYTEEVE